MFMAVDDLDSVGILEDEDVNVAYLTTSQN